MLSDLHIAILAKIEWCVYVCVLCVVWNVVPVDIFINKDVRHIIKKEGKSKKHKQIFWDFSNQSVVKNMRNLFNRSINRHCHQKLLSN